MAKKSRKQRKIETAKRIAKEQATKKSNIRIDETKISPAKYVPITKDEELVEALFKTANEINKQESQNWTVGYLSEKPNLVPERYVLATALKDESTGNVYYRMGPVPHFELYKYFMLQESKDILEGFIDNQYNFLSRSEAGELAYQTGQCHEYYRNSLISNGYKPINDSSFVFVRCSHPHSPEYY